MKKALLYCLVPLFFFSCKKDSHSVNPVAAGQKKYQVQFNVSGFQQEVLGAAKTNQTVRAASTRAAQAGEELVLHYLVYDSSGNLVKNVSEPSSSTQFATIKDSLTAGTYTVYFIAGASDILINWLSGSYITYNFPPPALGTGPAWEDTFTKKLTFTVSGGNVDQNVTLNRILGELEVDINRQIPAAATSLEVKVDNEYVLANLDGSIQTSQVSYRYKIFQIAPGTTTFDLLLLNTATPFNVDITAYDASNNQLAHATVSNVKCAVNTRTILTGGLFGSQNADFTISLNDQWVPVPYKTINF